MKPRVLIVSAEDQGGGAFIAARRLHRALCRNGYDSLMLVAKKNVNDPAILGPSSNVGHTKADLRHYISLPFHLLNKTNNINLHSFNVLPSGLHKLINSLDVDVVNLHWVNREMISVAEIGKINKPIVWTLHDMWPLLGSAHYEMFLDEKIAVADPSEKKISINLDAWMYRRKARHWSGRKQIFFACPSQWMADNVKKSRLFSGAESRRIANPLDMDMYKPHDRAVAREMLGLDKDKTYILFAAAAGSHDVRKGFIYLKRALQLMSGRGADADNIELLVLGGVPSSDRHIDDVSFKVNNLGRVHDDVTIKTVFNAADVFVTPSLADNLPNTIAESLSCGTPVVAFDKVGGIGDMVDHKSNGYLAKLKNVESLVEGIYWALDESNDKNFRSKIRESALSRFSEKLVADNYADFYASVIDAANVGS